MQNLNFLNFYILAVQDFFLIGIHATPDKIETNKEIAHLLNVYEDAQKKFFIDVTPR